MSSFNKELDLESLLVKFKLLGNYHLRLMFLIGFVAITNSWYSSNYVFVAEETKYSCKYPRCEEIFSTTTLLNMNEVGSKGLKNTVTQQKDPCSCTKDNSTDIASCNVWIYEDPNSFVAEFQLACEEWKRTLIGTVHSIGYMLGLLVVGLVSDKFGRKKVIIFYGVSGGIIGLARSVINSYWGYVVLEFVEGFIGDPYSPCFTLGIEMMSKDKRVLIMSYLNVFFAIGGFLKAFIAWAVSDWRLYLRITYAPAFLFIFYIFFMDESVRWLLSKGRKDEAVDIIRRAAKMNKIAIEDNLINHIKCEEKDRNTGLKELLKDTITSTRLLLRILACICMWITTTFTIYALLINSVSLEGNKYINYGISSLCGVPSSFAVALLLCRYRRRMPLILSLALTGIIFVIQSLIPKGYPWTAALLFYAGKFTSEIAFSAVYLYTSELFPTYTRNTMHALCSSIGRIGAILAPQTPLLAKYWPGLPSVLVGGLSLATVFVIVLMPDTSEDALPDTIRQAEELGSKETQENSNSIRSRL